MASFPAGKTPRFLDATGFAESMEWGGIDKGIEPVLAEVAGRIAANPALCRLAWHGLRRVFESSGGGSLNNWPLLDKSLGPDSGVFFLLIGMDLVPRLRLKHVSLGVSENITRDCCGRLADFSDNYRRMQHGRTGMLTGQTAWLGNFISHPLYRIGRLEFWLKSHGKNIVVLRNRGTSRIIALAGDKWLFDGDGFLIDPAEAGKYPGEWTARVARGTSSITGNPLSPQGRGIRREVTLSLDDWECVLTKGTTVLDLHIPGGGNMTPEACADSLKRAVEFFRRYYPEQTPVAVVCDSWIFSPILEEILPAGANLVRFLRETHLLPFADGMDVSYILNQQVFDPATAPRNTSLQRAVLDYLAAGNRWRSGAMFMLIEDIPRFGSQWYRAHWPPDALM